MRLDCTFPIKPTRNVKISCVSFVPILREIFFVRMLSIIFEKLLKNKISDTLQQNISKFQNGGMKGKGAVDNLFILRGIVNHANYLGKELWLTFMTQRNVSIVCGWKIV